MIGFMPIIIHIAAVWLYSLTEKSGRSSDLKPSLIRSAGGDQRARPSPSPEVSCGLLEAGRLQRSVAITHAMLVTLEGPQDLGPCRGRRS